jgi:hypothetical protein
MADLKYFRTYLGSEKEIAVQEDQDPGNDLVVISSGLP